MTTPRLCFYTLLLLISPTLFAKDKEKPAAPIAIPITGAGQTTTKLGNSYITRDTKTGSTLTTSPLGNSLITRSNSTKKDESAPRVIVIPPTR